MKTEIAITSINEGYELVSRALYRLIYRTISSCRMEKEIVTEFKPVDKVGNTDNLKSIKIIFKLSKGKKKCIRYTKYFSDDNSESGKLLISELEAMLNKYYTGRESITSTYSSSLEKYASIHYIKDNMPPFYINKVILGVPTLTDVTAFHKIFKLRFSKFAKHYPGIEQFLLDTTIPPDVLVSPMIGSEPIYFIGSTFTGVTTDGLASTVMKICKEYVEDDKLVLDSYAESLNILETNFSRFEYSIGRIMGPTITYHPVSNRKGIIEMCLLTKPRPIEFDKTSYASDSIVIP